MSRAAMWGLLTVVAAAAAVLSFASLRDLALLCGFAGSFAWLLPIVIDAGAAAGCLVWLGRGQHAGRRFARSLTWVLLASSMAGNAVMHGLSAYQLAPPWWLVVIVSAVAPAVLGAVVHLAVLTAQASSGRPELAAHGSDDGADGDGPLDCWATAPYAATLDGRAAELIDAGAGRRRLATELGITEHAARQLLASRNGAAQ